MCPNLRSHCLCVQVCVCLGLGNHCLCVQVYVCRGLGSYRLSFMCIYFMCLTKKTMFVIAYVLCTSMFYIFMRKQHQHCHHQPTLVALLLCVHLQKDNVNATITNLHSFHLYFVHLFRKMPSMLPSPTLLKSPKQSTISYLEPKIS